MAETWHIERKVRGKFCISREGPEATYPLDGPVIMSSVSEACMPPDRAFAELAVR
jgi:hypothetical protein